SLAARASPAGSTMPWHTCGSRSRATTRRAGWRRRMAISTRSATTRRSGSSLADAVHEASCSCGQLQVRAEGDPVRVSVCHCLACQRRTGSAFGAQARFPADRVTVTGTFTEYVRYAEDNGDERRFRFCPTCGSTVVYTSDDPDLIAV